MKHKHKKQQNILWPSYTGSPVPVLSRPSMGYCRCRLPEYFFACRDYSLVADHRNHFGLCHHRWDYRPIHRLHTRLEFLQSRNIKISLHKQFFKNSQTIWYKLKLVTIKERFTTKKNKLLVTLGSFLASCCLLSSSHNNPTDFLPIQYKNEQ